MPAEESVDRLILLSGLILYLLLAEAERNAETLAVIWVKSEASMVIEGSG